VSVGRVHVVHATASKAVLGARFVRPGQIPGSESERIGPYIAVT